MLETNVRLPDGRSLHVWVEGPTEGALLVWQHGTPSAGTPYRPRVEETTRRGLRWVSYSRPGYGDSTRHAGRSVADCAADVAAIADALGADRFYTAGGSGGGPHTLACGALLPERVLAVASIAGAAPYGAEGLDFLAGMGPENVDEFESALRGPEALRVWMDRHGDATANAISADDLLEALGGLVSHVDRAALSGEFGRSLVHDGRVALSNGYWGWFDDDLAFTRDWGFCLGSISVPVAIWQGRQDRFVPFAHGEWLASHVRDARARLLDEHGHLSLVVASFGQILDDLIGSTRAV